MRIQMLKSKLHNARITATLVDYEGSILIDEDLIKAANLLPYEKVLVANVESGQRAETYVIKGQKGSRKVELNGSIARMAQPGDRVIVMAFADMEPEEAATFKPTVVICDAQNKIQVKP